MTNLLIPDLTNDELARLCSHLDLDNNVTDQECWIWKYTSYRPKIIIRGTQYLVSRIVYKLFYKVDPGNFLVCHTCDNELCLNPKHLFLGTDADNSADRTSKGRTYTGTHIHPKRILSKEFADEMRLLYKYGSKPKELAERYQVQRYNIYNIVYRDGYAI